jgi:hypothetical protein
MANETGAMLKVITCLTCGGTRLAITDAGNIESAKKAIWDIPRHRDHLLDVIEAGGDGLRTEVESADGHVFVFPHVLHPPRRVGRD